MVAVGTIVSIARSVIVGCGRAVSVEGKDVVVGGGEDGVTALVAG